MSRIGLSCYLRLAGTRTWIHIQTIFLTMFGIRNRPTATHYCRLVSSVLHHHHHHHHPLPSSSYRKANSTPWFDLIRVRFFDMCEAHSPKHLLLNGGWGRGCVCAMKLSLSRGEGGGFWFKRLWAAHTHKIKFEPEVHLRTYRLALGGHPPTSYEPAISYFSVSSPTLVPIIV